MYGFFAKFKPNYLWHMHGYPPIFFLYFNNSIQFNSILFTLIQLSWSTIYFNGKKINMQSILFVILPSREEVRSGQRSSPY